MTRETELLEALTNLFRVCQATAGKLEEECHGLAEVGYWNSSEKAAYERAKRIIEKAIGKPVPENWGL